MTQTHTGGCPCGKVRYEVDMDVDVGEVFACRCSRCGRLGSLLALAPAERFRLLAGVSVRCVDDIDIASLTVKNVDGKHV